jgi:serine/threonine protein kinase
MPEEFHDYDIGCTLGCGAFGKVRKAIHRPTGGKVAIKFLMKKKIRTDEDRRRVRRET